MLLCVCSVFRTPALSLFPTNALLTAVRVCDRSAFRCGITKTDRGHIPGGCEWWSEAAREHGGGASGIGEGGERGLLEGWMEREDQDIHFDPALTA